MRAEAPGQSPDNYILDVLINHEGKYTPLMQVAATEEAIRRVGSGLAGSDTTIGITRKIDAMFMVFEHRDPSSELLARFQNNAADIAMAVEGALDRLKGEGYCNTEMAGESEFTLLHLLRRMDDPETQRVLAKRTVMSEGRTGRYARELLMEQAHSQERQIYPSTLEYLLRDPNIDIQEMAWSILERDNTTGYDLQTRQVPESIKQKILEMYDGGGQHRASVIISLLHDRTRGKEGEDLRGLAIERLVEELDRRTDWLRENFHTIVSAEKSTSVVPSITGPLPYLVNTRRSLERLVRSYDKEEPDVIKIGQRSLEHHAIQWQRLDQALPSWMSVRDSLVEIPIMNANS